MITKGVPLEDWQEWYERNKKSDLVRNDIVFGDADYAVVVQWARAHGRTRSGLEQGPTDVYTRQGFLR